MKAPQSPQTTQTTSTSILNETRVSVLRSAAEKGNGDAAFKLGYLYDEALGVNADYAEAAKWYLKGMQSGHPLSQVGYAVMKKNGQGQNQDEAGADLLLARALPQVKQLAEGGNAYAMTSLCGMYNSGNGVAEDAELALRWCRKAAELGDGVAMAFIAIFYSKGKSVGRDDDEALKWARKSADQGFPGAYIALGSLYRMGRGVTQD